ncbi:MAG: glycosyltransferase family 25 protein [Sphingobacteriales bacterium]|nr:MAG: glycosyltransferase family 25 protein [Sphingobacteriales bacterium]
MKWKIYIINLDTAVIRKKYMLRQFRKLGIKNFEFVEAISAIKKGEEWLQTQVNRKDLVRHMTGSEIACTLSHRKALETFIGQKDIEYGVFLEDDALLADDFVKSVEDGINFIAKDDILLLAASVQEPFDYNAVAKLGDNRVILKPVKPEARAFTAAGYLMPKAVAKRHTDSIYPITDVTDSWQHYKQRGSMDNIFISHPFVVETEVFQSSRAKRSLKDTVINWILFYQVPPFYKFFWKRRRVVETERLQNIHVIQ